MKLFSNQVEISAILFDGSNTLYKDDQVTRLEIIKFIRNLNVSKKLFFSNIGGLKCEDLLNSKNIPLDLFSFHKTSFDLMIEKLKLTHTDRKVHVYGNANVKEAINEICEVSDLKTCTDIIFCNLDFTGGIQRINQITRHLISHPIIELHLVNNDRVNTLKSSNITVANIFDCVRMSVENCNIKLKTHIYGKPFLTRADLDLGNENLLVVGDNKDTDGELAKILSSSFLKVDETNVISRLRELS